MIGSSTDPNEIIWPESLCGRYVLRVYANTGSGFASTPQVVLSPIPLESDRATSALGAAPLAAASSWHGFIDIDGDGKLDAMHMEPFFGSTLADPLITPPQTFEVFRGNGAGQFLGSGGSSTGFPYAWKAPALPGSDNALRNRARVRLSHSGVVANGSIADPRAVTNTFTEVMLADMNGDGLVDYIDSRGGSHPNRVKVFYNTGRGFENQSDTSGYRGTALETAAWGTERYANFDETHQFRFEQFSNGQVKGGFSRAVVRPVDIDVDGLLDLVVLQPPQRTQGNPWILDGATPSVRLFVNVGDRLVPMGTPPSVAAIWPALARIDLSDGGESWTVKTDFIDLDGDGSPEAYNNDGNVAACNADPVTHEWGLCGSDQTSRTTPRDGRAMRLLQRVTNGRGGDVSFEYAPQSGAPHPVWAVTKVIANAGPGATGGASPDMVTTYTYEKPQYVKDHRGDAGFRGFERVNMTSPGGATTSTTYAYTQHWAGLPVDVRVRDAAGHTVSITKQTWKKDTVLGGVVWSFHPLQREQRTCGAAQDEGACATAGLARFETETWEPLKPTGTSIAAYALGARYLSEAATITAGTKVSWYFTQLDSDTSRYFLRATSDQRVEYTAPGSAKKIAQTDHIWDTSNRVELHTDVHTGLGLPVARTSFSYDMATGNLKKLMRPGNAGAALWTTFGYDASATFVTKVTNELGHVVDSTYDPATGVQTAERGPNSKNGVQAGWTAKVDGMGRMLEKTVFVDDATLGYKPVIVSRSTYADAPTINGHCGTIAEDRVELAEDRWSRVTTEVDGAGRVVQRTERVGTGGAVTRTFYDAAGNAWRRDVPAPNGVDTGQLFATHTTTFDNFGRPIQVTEPNGGGERIAYDGALTTRDQVLANNTGVARHTRTRVDGFGRLVEVGELDGHGAWATTTYGYDGNDNLTKVIDADGVTTEFEHDWRSLRTKIIAGSRVWKYGHNLDGKLVSIIVPYPAGADPAAYTTTMVHDALGRETSRLAGSRGLTSAQLQQYGTASVQRVYDLNPTTNGLGRLGKVMLSTGSTELKYEARGLVRERRDQFSILGGTFTDVRTQRYTYDARGRIAEETFGDHNLPEMSTRVRHQRDDRGLASMDTWLNTNQVLAQHTHTLAGVTRTRALAGVYDATTRVDVLGRVIDQKIMTRRPDNGTLRTRLEVTDGYDGAGEVFGRSYMLDDGSGSGGPVESFSKTSGTASSMAALPGDECDDGVIACCVVEGTCPIVDTFGYTYDPQHQLVGATGPLGYTASFSYTPAGRVQTALVDVQPGAGDVRRRDVEYAYDVDDVPETPDRLIAPDGSSWLDLSYDLTGNVVSRVASDASYAHVYDGFDRQREVTTTGSGREVYWYDGDGNRTLIATFGANGSVQRVRWTVAGTEIWYGPSHAVTKTIAHVMGDGRSIVRIEDRAAVEHVFTDQYGHTLVAAAPDGALLAAFVYGPYGEIVRQVGSQTAEVLRRFNGKEADATTGLDYYGARYYDPRSLTWTQADPMYRVAPEFAGDEPRRMGLYTFSMNNPLAYVDPDGRDGWGLTFKSKKTESVDMHTGKDTSSKRRSVEVYSKTVGGGENFDALRIKVSASWLSVKVEAKAAVLHTEGSADLGIADAKGNLEFAVLSANADLSWKRASFGASVLNSKAGGSLETCLGTFSGEVEGRVGVKVGGGVKDGKIGGDFVFGSVAVGYDPSGLGRCLQREHILQFSLGLAIPSDVMQQLVTRDATNIESRPDESQQPAAPPEPEEDNRSEGGTAEDMRSPAPDYDDQRSWEAGVY